MVLNSNLVVRLAHVSASLCQYIACNPERLSSEQVLDLIFCLPFHHFGRLLLSLWTYLCYDPSPSNPFYLSSSSSSSSSGIDSDYSELDEAEDHPHLD